MTQYACDYSNLAPSGCTQYYFGSTTASVETYNFNGGNGQHLANQRQQICVRCGDQIQSGTIAIQQLMDSQAKSKLQKQYKELSGEPCDLDTDAPCVKLRVNRVEHMKYFISQA